jgi:hypothetical protein
VDDLTDRPADRAKFQRVLGRLAADRDGFAPPPDLLARTLAAVAASAQPPVWAARPAPDRDPVYAAWLRADVAVAACLGLVSTLLVTAGIAKVRADSRTVACQERMRELHTALVGYGETHAGRLPAPGGDGFAAGLARAGQLPVGLPAECPADPDGAAVPFHYTLGYLRPDGVLVGPRRDDPDGVPLLADPPADRSPHRGGQNVLFAGGRVRFTTVPTAGLNGDHIYRNDAGVVRAGLRPADAVLGGPADCP